MIRTAARVASLLLVWSLAHGSPWVDLSDDCLRALGQTDQPAGSLDDACPEVSQALQADPWNDLLLQPPDRMSAWSLVELRSMARYYGQAPHGPRVQTARLDAALAALPAPRAKDPPSVWKRLFEWLRGFLDDGNSLLPEWLEGFSLPEGALTWIWYTVLILVVSVAAGVVVNEVRHQSRRRVVADTGGAARNRMTSDDAAGVDDRSPRGQLEALFGGLVEHLQEAGMLAPKPSLTHREIAAAPELSGDQRRIVGDISDAAERAVYGGWLPAQAEVTPLVDAGRRLLNELGGAAT